MKTGTKEGFSGGTTGSGKDDGGWSSETGGLVIAGLGSIPLQPGELLAESIERPTSAPPPPGFGQDGVEERTRKAASKLSAMNSVRQTQDGEEDLRQQTQGNDNDRSNSFSTLAAVFGTGLALSMEDAAHEQNFSIDALFHPEQQQQQRDHLNFHRQSRHAASRLLAGNGGNGDNNDNNNTSVTRGFPSSLSSPPRGSEDRVQMLPGVFRHNSKDIGTNVSEPDDHPFRQEASLVSSQRIDVVKNSNNMQDVAELERGIGSLLSSTAREFKPTEPHSGLISTTSSVSDSVDNASDLTSRKAESDLQPYIWSEGPQQSRTIVVLHVSYLRVPDVRTACETFGIIENFRADFASRGIFFVSYYDIRSAQYAVTELQPILQRQSVMQRSSEEVVVKYCLSLNSSSQFDESRMVLSGLPVDVNEYALRNMLASYGSIRSVTVANMGGFVVEFHNSQDAKQAQLELDSSQPFGPDAFVEIATRANAERRKGRDLLAMLARWRQSLTRSHHHHQDSHQPVGPPVGPPVSADPWRAQQQQQPAAPFGANGHFVGGNTGGYPVGGGGQFHPQQQRETTQLVLGPDGRYTPVVIRSNQAPVYGGGAIEPQMQQQQIVRGPNGEMYLTAIPIQAQHAPVYLSGGRDGSLPSTIITSSNDSLRAPKSHHHTPYYTHMVSDAGSLSGLSGRSHRSAYSTGTEGQVEKDTRHLMLDLDAVEHGRDTRTSLMVRNIPNKYTQQMLLSEFEENGHGPGVIDFFYLPIDFKNRCNRGYAFINFVDTRDILAFHRQYFGKHWRTFNSDKICDITYARIQGKTAMLKRFENSALMEKDDEYKPLVFVSDGPEKGKRLPFPDPSSKASG